MILKCIINRKTTVVNFIKRKKRYYNNMNLTNINDNRHFWKTVEPFLSDKESYLSKINFVDKDEVISDDPTLVKTFSKYFKNAVKNLGVSEK